MEKYLTTSKSGAHIESTSRSTASATELAPAPESILSPVDIHVLEELVGDDSETIQEMLQDYRVSAKKTATELRIAYQAGQLATVGSIAHKLKSSSRSVGALVLGDLCAQIEQAGKENNAQALAVLLPSFDAEMNKVEAYLTSFSKKDN